MAPDLTQKDYEALAQVRYEIRRFLNFSEGMARSAGIEPRQHQLLLALRGLPKGARSTIGLLSKRLLIQHHSTVELVNRSVKAGLIRRTANEEDRREVALLLTRHGQQVLTTLSMAHRAELRSAAPALLQALGAIIAPDESKPKKPARTLALPVKRNPARSRRPAQ